MVGRSYSPSRLSSTNPRHPRHENAGLMTRQRSLRPKSESYQCLISLSVITTARQQQTQQQDRQDTGKALHGHLIRLDILPTGAAVLTLSQAEPPANTADASGPALTPAGLSPCPGGLGTQLMPRAQALPSTALTHRPSKPLSWAYSTPHWGGRTKPLVLGLFFYFQMDLFSGSIQGLPSLRGGRGPSARLILGGSRKKKKRRCEAGTLASGRRN